MDKLKMMGIIGTIILIGNISFFAFRIITPLVFWAIIGIIAVLVYVGLPKLKRE